MCIVQLNSHTILTMNMEEKNDRAFSLELFYLLHLMKICCVRVYYVHKFIQKILVQNWVTNLCCNKTLFCEIEKLIENKYREYGGYEVL